jgi:hypothetical protein
MLPVLSGPEEKMLSQGVEMFDTALIVSYVKYNMLTIKIVHEPITIDVMYQLMYVGGVKFLGVKTPLTYQKKML